MKADELYGEGGYRCEFFDLPPANGLLTVSVQFQTLEVGTMNPLRDIPSPLPLPTMEPLVAKCDGPPLLPAILRRISSAPCSYDRRTLVNPTSIIHTSFAPAR